MVSNSKGKSLRFWQIMTSVLASFIGVQSSRKRERDFTEGKARDFIFVGVLLMLGFVFVVLGVVLLVMHFAM